MKQAKIRDHAISCILFVLSVFAQWQGMDEGGLDGVAFHVKDRQRGSATFRSSRFQGPIGVQWRVCRFCAVLFQNGVRRASPCHKGRCLNFLLDASMGMHELRMTRGVYYVEKWRIPSTKCVPNDSGMFLECFWNVSGMFPECFLNVSDMFPECCWNVSRMFLECFGNSSGVFPY